MPTIGIDLGTTSCRVGLWKENHVQILSNEEGSKSTPPFVSFSEGDVAVGESARSRAYRNAKNTIFNVKRFIGCDELVTRGIVEEMPFNVGEHDGRPHVLVDHGRGPEHFLPEEITAHVLAEVRRIASTQLGEPVKDAVISVPSFFDGFQRKSTSIAGVMAGLNVLSVISEPVAAAAAYNHRKQQINPNQPEEIKQVLVLDLGGGTFDATLVVMDGGVIEVKATAGTNKLGGEDLDTRLVDFCVEDFRRRRGIDIRQNQRALRRLRNACEVAKRNLSIASQAYIDIDTLANDFDYNVSITQYQFDDICQDLFAAVVDLIEDVLRKAKVSKENVDDIVMVGGSSRIPRIVAVVSDYFGKEPDKSLHADEAVVYGTALTAAIKIGTSSPILDEMLVLDVLPVSLGIETQGGTMIPIMKRHTCIPGKKEVKFTTVFDNQPTVFIKVYQGEHSRAKDNRIIGVLQLTNLPLAPKGTLVIEINLDVASALDVVVTARETKSGQSVSSNISFHLGERFPVFSDPYTANFAIQPLSNGPPPSQPQPSAPKQDVPAAQTEPTTPAPSTFDQRPSPFNFSTPNFPTPTPFAQPAPVSPQANTFDFRTPNNFGPFTPNQDAYGVPPPPPPPPLQPQPPLVQPNGYPNGVTSTEERLRIMEERYDLLEAKHAALEAKVRVLEIALSSRR
ncbi:70-kilodalton heat shock protein [Pleurotus ostreatus]|uniref:70-kilodalton heat shock protein n=1 Tax=Pleurotus ostreatus TaxID=5322 RepID=A0A8H7DTH8_PLEOS|nr:70-kilodalton heat shock protein [Pleurotus ostreatus]KAF7436204.1 70-kilodalton heat shock protein [Pleurotus ostreatus]KAJ8701853.1 Hsp70 chaperone [Pleurotus ostreatus]